MPLFRLCIEMNVDFRKVGSDMSSEWAKNLVRQRAERQEQRRIEDQKALSDRAMVRDNFESRWTSVCSLLVGLIEDLNTESGEDVLRIGIAADMAAISIKDSPNIIASVKADARNYALKVPFHGPEIQLQVSGRNELVWKSTGTHDVWDDEQVARKTAEYAWNFLSRS
jgi:hypothetical protein